MRLTKILHKFSIPKLRFLSLENVLSKGINDLNVLWNDLACFVKMLRLLKQIILIYATTVLCVSIVSSGVYQKKLWQIILWANIPTYLFLIIYLKYRYKSLNLYSQFVREIEKRNARNINLKLSNTKIFLLNEVPTLSTFYSLRVLCILYGFWIIGNYFYFYPNPRQVESLVLEAQEIQMKIQKYQAKSITRFEKEKRICDKIQNLYIHKEREDKKRQTLQRKMYGRYGKLKQVQHKIVELNRHLSKEKKEQNYLSSNKEIIKELSNWIALKGELTGVKIVFDEKKSDLKAILVDLIHKYHRVKQKEQNAIYQEQLMLKELMKRKETLHNLILKLEQYQAEQEKASKQKLTS